LALGILVLCVLCGSVSSKIYGVNIGGWLVLESWIVPSLFSSVGNGNIKDEWTWGQYGGSVSLLQKHWSTWFTETDAKALSAAGITHLRIPIGYWIVCTAAELKQNNEPYVTGAWPWLVDGIALAKKYNMKVLIDLHGAPGSQNGFDNSGRAGATQFGTGNTVARTITYLERIAQNIVSLEQNSTTSNTVWGLELVNEPTPWGISGGMNTIRSFYTQAYPVVRKYLTADKYAVVIQQGFQTDWQGFFPSPQYQNIYLDMHTYHAFSPFPTTTTQTEQITVTCTSDKQNSVTSQTLQTFTGEWSAATNANYPGSSIAAFRKKWALAQMNAYESGDKGQGWFFWNFKTESADDWNYILGVQQGWLPKTVPSNDTSTGCQWWCNNDCCLANTGSSAADVQSSLTWACSSGKVDCSPINNGGVYYQPNDLNHHASFAFNEYWAAHRSEGSASGCSFSGTATYCSTNCAGRV